MTDAELNRYATLICDAIQDKDVKSALAAVNTAIARERARQPVKQPRGGLDVPWNTIGTPFAR